MKSITIKRYSIKQLWRLCDDAKFAVPEIQREFVWDPRRASDLLDSVSKHLPIGSLLVWRTHRDRKHLLRHAQRILPPHDSRNRDIWFLIDGQQRLSVLYAGMVVEDSTVGDFFAAPRHPYSAALLAATPKYTDPQAGLNPVPDSVIAAVRAEVAAFDRSAAHG